MRFPAIMGRYGFYISNFSSSILGQEKQSFRGTWGFREWENDVLINCGLMRTLPGQMFRQSYLRCKNSK